MEDKLEKARKIAKEFIAANKHWLEADGRKLKKFEFKANAGLEEIPEEYRDVDFEWPLIEGMNDLCFYKPDFDDFDPDDIDDLLQQAKTDPVAYEACLELIILCLKRDYPIGGFRKFLLNHLQMDVKLPYHKGPSAHSNRPRNILITMAVIKISKKTGIPCSRNDASNSHSACDVVAEELNLSFESIKRTWLKHRNDPHLWSRETYLRHFDDGSVLD